MLTEISKLRNYYLTDEEIKLLNLVKIIVSGGWIIDDSIFNEVTLMVGINDINARKMKAKAENF